MLSLCFYTTHDKRIWDLGFDVFGGSMIYLRVTSDELVVFLELSTLRRPIICIRSFNNALV
jgi:hypothetical protein